MTLVLNISQIIFDVIKSEFRKGVFTSSFVDLRENIKLTVKIIFSDVQFLDPCLCGEGQTDTLISIGRLLPLLLLPQSQQAEVTHNCLFT